ncbi:LuxR C-terminal-related transcriptional regulator [Raoultella sp. Ech2A]|uniref:LuxR C-terminal-related transcriptional regulator n=1 Tax=Raoultella TaxID=160674 RepID=UPI0005F84E61|nr:MULTISPECIES: LuxR C-terminal-related transcriptional regulator [Raoultella]MDJ1655432.1 LuxR C-terminal-related transcriptional regulator [Raoultella sp. Ech2A]
MNSDKPDFFFNHYDLWIKNSLLRQGLQLILDSLSPSCFHGKYVFFTSDNYYSVLNHKYNQRKVRFVLLTDGNDLNFLSEIPMFRISARSTPAEIKSFILRPTLYSKKPDGESEGIILTSREKAVIRLMNDGEAIVNIGKSLNLHIKTIYQIRLTLIKKLGCSGRTDFFNISRSETFKAWSQLNS